MRAPNLRLVENRCSTCHALGHDAEAHTDVTAAIRLTDDLIARGKTLEARAWLRVVTKLARRSA